MSSGATEVVGRSEIEVSRLAAPEALAALAQRANDAHRSVRRLAGEGLAHAIEAGGALREVKQRVPAGRWLAWLSENVEFSVRTAQLYMKLAQECAAGDVQPLADMSLRAAAKAVVAPRASARSSPGPARSSVRAASERAPRGPAEPRPDRETIGRVRSVLSAIDPLLARAQTEELSAEAAGGLLLEAASAARAVSDKLQALARELGP